MIDRLPDTVLEEFFFQYLMCIVQNDPSQLDRARVALLSVCPRWNALVTGSKRLWSSIYVGQKRTLDLIPPPHILRMWIERSGETPLAVYIEYEEKTEEYPLRVAVEQSDNSEAKGEEDPEDVSSTAAGDEEDQQDDPSPVADGDDSDSSSGTADEDANVPQIQVLYHRRPRVPSPDIGPFTTCINLLAPTIARWRHFTLNSYTPMDRKWVQPIESIPFERANQLQNAHFKPSWNMPVPDSVLQQLSTLPSLCSLIWWPASYRYTNTGQDFASLRRLSLAGNFMTYVADVLQITPTITHLTIRLTTCHCCCEPSEIPAGTRILLPHLEFLSIEAVFDNHKFLDMLEAPKLTLLAVTEPIVDMEPFGEEGVGELHPALHRYLSSAPEHLRGIILESQFTVNHLVEFFSYPVVENLGVLEIIHHLSEKDLYDENVWERVLRSAEVSDEIKRRLSFEKHPGRRKGTEVQVVGWRGANESRAFEAILPDVKSKNTFDDREDRWDRAILGVA
ncbi:hypothetical protein NP233_g7231 [Leucocoprinus birnbaumii]|uniref:F-box domain-containing protein n=1 Tax=Leucocoprinus birnbaumii TaxID=56174 RepID=A0AAD5VPM5_9AGAR|nr:hypothetical protein NP233_g7231 [Leucocoprinus birnbaumii]